MGVVPPFFARSVLFLWCVNCAAVVCMYRAGTWEGRLGTTVVMMLAHSVLSPLFDKQLRRHCVERRLSVTTFRVVTSAFDRAATYVQLLGVVSCWGCWYFVGHNRNRAICCLISLGAAAYVAGVFTTSATAKWGLVHHDSRQNKHLVSVGTSFRFDAKNIGLPVEGRGDLTTSERERKSAAIEAASNRDHKREPATAFGDVRFVDLGDEDGSAPKLDMEQNLLRAQVLLTDLLRGSHPNPVLVATCGSSDLWYYVWRQKKAWKRAVLGAILVMMGLATFETPGTWKHNAGTWGRSELLASHRAVTNGVLWAIEGLCLGICAVDIFFEASCLGLRGYLGLDAGSPEQHQRGVRLSFAAMVAGLALALGLTAGSGGNPPGLVLYARCLRPLLPITRMRSLHRLSKLIWLTAGRIRRVLVFLVCVILFFAQLGVVLFGTCQEVFLVGGTGSAAKPERVAACLAGNADRAACDVVGAALRKSAMSEPKCTWIEGNPVGVGGLAGGGAAAAAAAAGGCLPTPRYFFRDITTAVIDLFVLISSDNLTQLTNSRFCGERTSALYFVVYTFIAQILVMNLMIVNYYEAYKTFQLRNIRSRFRSEEETLLVIFELSTQDADDAQMTLCTWMKLTKSVGIKTSSALGQFMMLDNDRSGTLGQYEFMSCVDELLARTQEQENIARADVYWQRGGRSQRDGVGSASDRGGGCVEGGRRWMRAARKSWRSALMEATTNTMPVVALTWRPSVRRGIGLLLAMHMMVLGLMSPRERGLGVSAATLDAVCAVLLLLQFAEVQLRRWLTNDKRIFRKNNKLDWLVVNAAMLLFGGLLVYGLGRARAEGKEGALAMNEALFKARPAFVLPMLRVFSSLKYVKHTLTLLVRVVRPFMHLVWLALCCFCFFATLGMSVFSGTFEEGWQVDGDIAATQVSNSFDTFPDALITLFLIFMGEGTGEISAWAVTRSSGFAVWYFIGFQVLTVWFISHLFVGIVFDYFLKEQKLRRFAEEQRFHEMKRAHASGKAREQHERAGPVTEIKTRALRNSTADYYGTDLELDKIERRMQLLRKLDNGEVSLGDYRELVEAEYQAAGGGGGDGGGGSTGSSGSGSSSSGLEGASRLERRSGGGGGASGGGGDDGGGGGEQRPNLGDTRGGGWMTSSAGQHRGLGGGRVERTILERYPSAQQWYKERIYDREQAEMSGRRDRSTTTVQREERRHKERQSDLRARVREATLERHSTLSMQGSKQQLVGRRATQAAANLATNELRSSLGARPTMFNMDQASFSHANPMMNAGHDRTPSGDARAAAALRMNAGHGRTPSGEARVAAAFSLDDGEEL
jgi:hypothetical protein